MSKSPGPKVRSPLPPAGALEKTPSQETIKVLQNHLNGAEQDAKVLLEQLAMVSAPVEKKTSKGNKAKGANTLSPFKARIPDPEVMAKNYEMLVSRTCRLESTMQTLKLNLCSVQAERDLNNKHNAKANEKLTHAVAAYDKEIKKLKRCNDTLKNEAKSVFERKTEMEKQVMILKVALDHENSAKNDASGKLEDLTVTKQKLSKRNAELREDLTRETKLRQSLEESQAAQMTRLNEMEAMMETQKNEMKTLSSECGGMRKETVSSREELKSEKNLREKAEATLKKLSLQAEKRDRLVETLEDEKKLLLIEMGKVKGLYKDLNTQLESMQRVIEDKQEMFLKMESENKSLQQAYLSATEENTQLINKYEERIKAERDGFLQKFGEQDGIIELTEKLRAETRDRELLEQRNNQLKEQVTHLKERLEDAENRNGLEGEQLEREVFHLKEQLNAMATDKQKSLKDKENLLEEVNQAVDDMSEERTQLTADLQQCRVEVDSLQKTKTHLEQENIRLQSRLDTLEHSQSAHLQVDQAMTEMLEQKNRLAYDKGRLQTKVDHLQSELESLANSQTELMQLRKNNQTIEAKYSKVLQDLNATKLAMQKIEDQLKQLQSDARRKDRDFALAIGSRDDAVKEAQKLMGHIEALEDRERSRVSSLQKSLVEAHDDNKNMTSTLESIMSSHSQLQLAIEQLQVQLGRKDSELSQLQQEKQQSQISSQHMNKQLEALQDKLRAVENLESNDIDPLRQALESSRQENMKMAGTLENVLQTNKHLQTTIDRLQDDVEQKSYFAEQLKGARETESDQRQQDVSQYKSRIESLQQQLKKERERTLKKTNKEVSEAKRHNEELTTRNGEMSRANTELRHKVTELEFSIKDLKAKLGSQRAQIEVLQKCKKNHEESVEKLKKVQADVTDLERMKNKYVKKNEDQARTINKFMSQIVALQSELKSLSAAQLRTGSHVHQQEEELEKQRQINEELKMKYQMTKKHEGELSKISHQMEVRLQEANKESRHIASSLEEAHDWFKVKFDTLQEELSHSKHSQEELEQLAAAQRRNVEEEQFKARNVAEKAEKILRLNRLKVSKIADAAEVTQKETLDKMRQMYSDLEAEREHANIVQESSLRQVEDLAKSFQKTSTPYSKYQ
ncbi:coiled-coil domain-containing protein 150-like [Lineus longissimus]|uniref:coiled-coil domain-containing protein 150-like n=1 Tax=Lineus longissimus TaxID=88925 RepID=UPI002B4CE093